MDGPNHTDPAQGPKDKSDLIESIYRIALEPQTYDSFMGHWDEFIQDQMAKLIDLQSDSETADLKIDATEIANHFAIAMQLLEQAGRPEAQDKTEQPRTPLPQLLFSSTGKVVWHNNAARRTFDLRNGTTLADFDLAPAQRKDIDSLLAGTSSSQIVLARIGSPQSSKPIPMSFQPSSASANEQLFMATELRQSWPANTGALLASGFGLSQSEIDICELIVAGHSATDIADTRQSALGTVRTQIKKILQKTNVSGQVELASLLHATMRLAETSSTPVLPAAKIPDSIINIQRPDRVMPVETFGDPSGTPVIFFHGMLDGNSMTNKHRKMLKENNFYLICPVRPCFGTATPDDSGTIATAPQRFAHDIAALVETMGAKQPILMGHMAGAVYAYVAAKQLGDQTRGVLSIAGAAPITSAAQFAAMSVRQRIVALTARYTPRVLPFVVRAGISQLDNAGEQNFMHSLYQYSPHDLRVSSDPEISDIIISGYHFTIAQGHRAFEIDSYHVVRDWSAALADTGYPIELLHGVGDPVVSIASVTDFQRSLGQRAKLTALEETGQLICYARPEAVIAALVRLRDGQKDQPC